MAPLLSVVVLLLLLLLIHLSCSRAGQISKEFLYPDSNFTTFEFIDTQGVFLFSPNSTFSAELYDPDRKNERFYLALLHTHSGTVVWTANPDSPVPFSSTLSLSSASLSLLYPNGSVAWSTPKLGIHALQLLDSGNLVLLDANNSTLWQSFDRPTNTLLPGQRLPVGSYLSSPKSDSDFSDGGHRLIIDPDDASLRWKGLQYWRLSKDARSVKDYSADVAYMALNATGLFLFDASYRPVFRLALPPATGFRAGRMEPDGRFTIAGGNDFVAPAGRCDLPLSCGSLGLCTSGSNGSDCSCPPSFGATANIGCSPTDGSVLGSPSSCGASSYLSLGGGIEYFANDYLSVAASGDDFSSCRSLCSTNCSCLGFFYRNSSRSCYLLKDQLGSLIRTSQPSSTGIGYTKILKSNSPPPAAAAARGSSNLLPILLPSIATILLVLTLSLVGLRWWRTRRNSKNDQASKSPVNGVKLGRQWHHWQAGGDDEFSDGDEISIPGLPTRFTYTELALATNNFGTLIGTGGFGSVYKGELQDGTLVAVKRITNMGIQGKREFCTEIAVIGKIHHINLVRLRGFCVQGTDRMLVYDYMNRGSLDRSLFGQGQCPVLEWQERLEIAVGAARGLAYLHTSCDQKIIHCDIKPENILLADGGQVKIADFGMAKLISPDQSGLFTTMRGTRGYLAPEWLTNSAITDKTDVYSYGMVLLEMVRGRKNSFGGSVSVGTSSGSTSFGSSGEEYFPIVAVEKHVEGRWVELVDPRMEGRVAAAEVERTVKVALCCLHEEPAMRPSMAAVAGMLEGTAAVPVPVVEGLRFLRLYRRGVGEVVTVGYVASESTAAATASLLTFVSSQEVSGPR